MRWRAYDELIEQATAAEDDVVAARADWERLTGEVRPEHELYHERSDAFVEWYLLDRKSPGGPGAGRTPVEVAIDQASDDSTRAALRSLRTAQRSLYLVASLRPGGLVLDDVYGGGRFDVDERRRLPGVRQGDLLDARLVADPEQLYRLLLGRAVQFHPREAAPTLIALVKEGRQRGEPRAQLLNHLLRLRLRALAYRHVSPARIYSQPTLP
jgi:hypothetical protein